MTLLKNVLNEFGPLIKEFQHPKLVKAKCLKKSQQGKNVALDVHEYETNTPTYIQESTFSVFPSPPPLIFWRSFEFVKRIFAPMALQHLSTPTKNTKNSHLPKQIAIGMSMCPERTYHKNVGNMSTDFQFQQTCSKYYIVIESCALEIGIYSGEGSGALVVEFISLVLFAAFFRVGSGRWWWVCTSWITRLENLLVSQICTNSCLTHPNALDQNSLTFIILWSHIDTQLS